MMSIEKIIKFMWLKEGFVEKNTGRVGAYFRNDDACALEAMAACGKLDADRWWARLIADIATGATCGFSDLTWPFCGVYKGGRCDECPYGASHGYCSDDTSDYRLIRREMGSTLPINSWYREAIATIEEMARTDKAEEKAWMLYCSRVVGGDKQHAAGYFCFAPSVEAAQSTIRKAKPSIGVLRTGPLLGEGGETVGMHNILIHDPENAPGLGRRKDLETTTVKEFLAITEMYRAMDILRYGALQRASIKGWLDKEARRKGYKDRLHAFCSLKTKVEERPRCHWVSKDGKVKCCAFARWDIIPHANERAGDRRPVGQACSEHLGPMLAPGRDYNVERIEKKAE